MAILSKDQALKLIKEPKHAREIAKAKQKRTRHKLHTEPEIETENGFFSEPLTRFLFWVRQVLQSDENYARYVQLCRPPVPTNEFTETIFSEFEKVFEGQNRWEKFNFSDSETENDAAEYRKQIGDYNFWPTQGFETFKNSIDNILVIDLPRLNRDEEGNFIQPSDRPEPYYFILDIDHLIDIDNDKIKGTNPQTGEQFYYFKCEYIIFEAESEINENEDAEKSYIYVFDDQFFRVFDKVGDNEYTMISEAPHGLTYCPARSFWTTPLNSRSNIQKRGPITNSLSDLDWLLFFSISERYLQLYAPFPIYAVYKNKCDYKNTADKSRCVDGFLEFEGAFFDPNNRKKCPKCSHKIKVGPGNILLINPPKDAKEDPDQMSNPMKVIPAEKESLDYMKAALQDMRDNIFSNCVGKEVDINIKQAQNEKQVDAGFESQQSVLLKIKRNFEIIHLFALDTIYRLRYGAKYISGSINYGDVFFNKDEDTETAELESATKVGAPAYEISMRRDSINNARYRNNPDAIERLKILKNLDPFPDQDLKTLSDLKKTFPNLVDEREFAIKFKFNSFIDRFEREQTNILLFARAVDFDRKIILIRDELLRYADEYLAAIKPLAAPTPPPVIPAPGVPAPAI